MLPAAQLLQFLLGVLLNTLAALSGIRRVFKNQLQRFFRIRPRKTLFSLGQVRIRQTIKRIRRIRKRDYIQLKNFDGSVLEIGSWRTFFQPLTIS